MNEEKALFEKKLQNYILWHGVWNLNPTSMLVRLHTSPWGGGGGGGGVVLTVYSQKRLIA